MAGKVMVCRKCKGRKCLVEFLEDVAGVKVVPVGCQKICKGPVVGLSVEGRMEWFERVNAPKPMVAVARLAGAKGHGRIRPALERRRVRKRSGAAPR